MKKSSLKPTYFSSNSRQFATATGSNWFFLVFFVAVIVRVFNLILTDLSPDAVLLEDAAMYWESVTTTENFWDAATQIVFEQHERMPAYPLFLATIVLIFGEHILPVLVVQCIVDSITCLLIMALGRHIYPKKFQIFGLTAAIWPNLFIHSSFILTDCLFTFLFTWFLLSSANLLKKPTFRHALLVGALLGLATLVRPVTQFFILLTPIVLPVILILSKTNLKTAFIQSLIIFSSASLLISPLLVNNFLKYDSVALTSQNGPHLQNWVVSEVVMLRDGIGRDKAVMQLQAKTNEALASSTAGHLTNPFVRSAQQLDTALEELAATPLRTITKSWLQGAIINLAAPASMIDKRIRQLPHISFASDTTGDLLERSLQFVSKSSSTYVLVLTISAIGAIIVSLLQFFGLCIKARVNGMLTILSVLTVAYFLIITGPVGSPKYRLPIEPILIIWLGCALISFWKKLKEFHYRRTHP